MRVLNDFHCTVCDFTGEYFLDNGTPSVTCLDCGNPAKKVQRPIRSSLDPISGDFPSATSAWENRRSQHMKLEQKASHYDPS